MVLADHDAIALIARIRQLEIRPPAEIPSRVRISPTRSLRQRHDRELLARGATKSEDEKARLATEKAKKAEQDKAAAAAKAAEDARIAAEKAKQFEEAKAAAAEQRRKDAEAAVAKAGREASR